MEAVLSSEDEDISLIGEELCVTGGTVLMLSGETLFAEVQLATTTLRMTKNAVEIQTLRITLVCSQKN